MTHRVWWRLAAGAVAGIGLAASCVARAQDMSPDYQEVLRILGRKGDFKANVLKVSIPRNDLNVTVDGIATPTPFGFGGWIAMTKGDGGEDVMMGDLVLLEDEVNPIMSALLENGLDVTALHNHFFWETPRIFYMHVHGHGMAADIAKSIKSALEIIGKAPKRAAGPPTAPSNSGVLPPPPPQGGDAKLDTAAIVKIVGHEGE